MINSYRIGTRKSPLALKQTEIVLEALKKAYPNNSKLQAPEIVGITTSGDSIQNKSLAEIGGKALFVKEIEQALLNNKIDFGIHSLKDVEANLHPSFKLACVLEREILNDVLITKDIETASILNLKKCAKVGTCSPRRAAQLLDIRPDLEIIPLRGNVITRLGKLKNENLDASVFAYAGLKRLDLINEQGELNGYPQFKACILTLEEMIPAVGQGVLTVETLASNQPILDMLKVINHLETEMCTRAERAFLRELGGNCKTPIAGYALVTADQNLLLKVFYAPILDAFQNSSLSCSGLTRASMDPRVEHEDDNVGKLGFERSLFNQPLIRFQAFGDFNNPEELGIKVAQEIKLLSKTL